MGFALEASDNPSFVFGAVFLLTDVHVFLAIPEHAVNQAGKFVRRGSNSDLRIPSGAHATRIGSEGALTLEEALHAHAQSISDSIHDFAGATSQHLPATD